MRCDTGWTNGAWRSLVSARALGARGPRFESGRPDYECRLQTNSADPRMVVRYLHVLAMATFVGGQLVLAACVVPALRSDRDALRAVARRFGWATLVALGVLVLTGAWLARGRW